MWESRHLGRRRAGFSLLELIVVISVALLLASLMTPAMSHLKENARRVVCSSNQRQQGLAMFMYASDSNDELPSSAPLRWSEPMPQELMVAHLGRQMTASSAEQESRAWDGLGLLYSGGYCQSIECFYCPSHHGAHDLERYRNEWLANTLPGMSALEDEPFGQDAIYTNYHYGGDLDWSPQRHRRRLEGGEGLVLATDGLRTALDFNHEVGMNVLRGDGSVIWKDDVENIYERLPSGLHDLDPADYSRLWQDIEAASR